MSSLYISDANKIDDHYYLDRRANPTFPMATLEIPTPFGRVEREGERER